MNAQRLKKRLPSSDETQPSQKICRIVATPEAEKDLRQNVDRRIDELVKRRSAQAVDIDKAAGEQKTISPKDEATVVKKIKQLNDKYFAANIIEHTVCKERRLALGQVKKIAGLTRRQIIYWQSVDAMFFGQEGAYDPRRFSIGDVIKLMIIKEIKQNTGIPPKRLNRFVSWIQRYNIVDARLHDFSVGRDIFLYSDLKSIWYSGHGVDGRVPQKWGDKPIVLMPLNDIFKKVLLNPAVFSDKFRVEKQGEQFVYFINGKKFDFASYKNHPNPGGLKLTLQKSDLPIVFNYRVKKYALHSTDGGGLVLKNAESK